MAILNGTTLKLERGGNAISFQSECSISFEREEIETTHKTSGGKKAVIAGKRSASVSFSGFLDDASSATSPNYDEILADWETGASTTFAMTNGATNATLVEFSGSCVLTSFEVSAGVEDSVQISGSFVVTGAVTYDNDGA